MSKNLFLLVALVLGVWGVFGALDVPKQPYSGYSSDADGLVTEVDEDSPAAAAGMQVGDQVRSVAGVSMDDSDGQSTLRRAEVGESRTIVVDRGGQEATLDLTYARSELSFGSYSGILMGVIFLLMGLWSFFKAPHAGTRRLALLGCCVGPIFLAGPYLGPGFLSNLSAAVVVTGLAMGFALLFDFVIRSGKPNGYGEGGGGPAWLYWPAVLVALLFIALVIVQPDADGAFATMIQFVVGAYFLVYFGGALFMVVRNHMKADAGLRASRGLGMMLAGAVIGLAPLTLAFLVGLLPGDVTIPGGQYWSFGLVAVPITFALAAVKGGQAERV